MRLQCGFLGDQVRRIAARVVKHAERTHVHESRAVLQARIDNVAGAPYRPGLELAWSSAHRSAHVVNGGYAGDGVRDDRGITQVTHHHLHARILCERCDRPPDQHAHALAPLAQRGHQGTPEETRRAGDQCLNRLQRLKSRGELFVAEPIGFGARRFQEPRDAQRILPIDRGALAAPYRLGERSGTAADTG